MDFMPVLTQHFLNMIQPNPFPEDLIGNFIVDYENVKKDLDTIRALLLYELGFLVCAVIGLLYMVLMPVIGGILACCRCSGNCGGRMYQRQTPRTDTYRRALYWSLFTTTSIVLLGNFFMFKSNASFKVSVDQINGTLNDLHAYFTAVPEQFDHMMNESFDKVSDEINNIGPKLGGEIQRSLDGVGPALNSIRMMANLNHDNTTENLHNLYNILQLLFERITASHGFNERISKSVTILEDEETLIECKSNTTCQNLVKEYHAQLISDHFVKMLDFTYINQSLSNFQSAVEAVKWDSLLHEGNAYLNNIPQNVTSDIRNVVLHMKNNLKHTQTQIFQATSDHLVFVLTNVTDALPQLQGKISMIAPEVERADHITWAVGVVLCCMVLLVVVCNILGLVLGPLGLEPKADPIVRSSTAHCGGIVLLFSAGFIFLFSWLLMGVVLMLFVPGGNMYALVCKPWNDGEQSKLIDTAGLIGFELGSMLGLNRNLTLTGVYRDCQKNMSLWSTLHMNEIINPEEGLNLSQKTDVILSSVNITPIILLSHVVDQIDKLHNVTINFTRFTEQIDMIYSIDLNHMSEELKKYGTGTSYIDDAVYYLNKAYEQLNYLKTLHVGRLNSTIEKLQSNVNETNRKVSNVLGIMGNAQQVINNCTTQQFIKTEHRASVDSQLDNVTVAYAECTNLTQHVARCGPVARAVDSVKNIICENMLESLNTFWFSLGWCLIFFIPSIIFSIKLAKYYRRMEESDRYYKRMEEANRYDRIMKESDRAVESSVRHASSQNL